MSIKHLYLIAVPAILACAPASGTSGSSGAPPASRSSTLLAAEEIRAVNADRGTAHDAISRLRPNWLTRGTTSFDPPSTEFPVVFLDGRLYGELETLRSIDASQIADVRYYSPAEAGGRFGLQGGLSGVIEVRTKKR
jgi:hypothetical protein